MTSRVLPPPGLVRRLSVQSVLFAIGEGAFLTGNAVFFTRITGLSAAQVGLGITLGGAAALLTAVPLGRLADRFGAQRTWVLSSLVGAVLYGVWPLVEGFGQYVVVVVVLEVVGVAGWSGRGAYTLAVLPRGERVQAQAWMRAALNAGFTVGALLGGIALATDSDRVVRLVPLVTGAILLLNAAYVARLPRVEAQPGDPTVAPPEPGRAGLRNRGFLATSFCSGVLSTNNVLLTIVIPLWLVQETDAPHVLLAWLFGTNTVLAVLLQVRAARGVESVSTAVRATQTSAVFFVASCAIVAVTGDTLGWVTIALVWLGHVTVTGAELFQSAGTWGLVSELSDPQRLGEYQGASMLGTGVGRLWAPALYTWLAIDHGALGWGVIAAIVVAAAVAVGPSARAAERHLAQRSFAPTPGLTG